MVLERAVVVALALALVAAVLLGLLNRQAGPMRVAPAWLGLFFVVLAAILTAAFWSGD